MIPSRGEIVSGNIDEDLVLHALELTCLDTVAFIEQTLRSTASHQGVLGVLRPELVMASAEETIQKSVGQYLRDIHPRPERRKQRQY